MLKQLIQDDLHKPVSFFLPPEHSAWNNNMPNWANVVTIHHLLTHTSGIKKINETTFDEILECTPGQQFSYSNPNYALIGTIVSEVTKTPLDISNIFFDLYGCYNCDAYRSVKIGV